MTTSPDPSAALVHLAVTDGTATITLDSSANRNALSARLRTELSAHLDTALVDERVRVVVLTHTGPVFCSGMDLREASAGGSGMTGAADFPGILERLWTSPKPVVARLAGPARAGGVGLVAACDLAVAADTASFAFSEVRIGVVPAVISVTVLPRLLPRAAHELFLTGETFGADRAVAIGLLTSSVPGDRLDDEVGRVARMLALGAPEALAATKRLLRGAFDGEEVPLRPRLEAMAARSAAYFASAEGQEGMAAFREKRPAAWVPPAPDPVGA